MNEKLDFQEMKSIHEIMVTRRDIQEGLQWWNWHPSPSSLRKKQGFSYGDGCYCRRYFISWNLLLKAKFLPLKLNSLLDHHHSCEICCGMICHCCSHWEGNLNFERVPLKLQRANKSKRERERERQRRKRKGRGREVSCLWIMKKIIMTGSLIFWGRFFGRSEKRIQALNRPDIF